MADDKKDSSEGSCSCGQNGCGCRRRCGGCKFLAGLIVGLLLAGTAFGIYLAGRCSGHGMCAAMHKSMCPYEQMQQPGQPLPPMMAHPGKK